MPDQDAVQEHQRQTARMLRALPSARPSATPGASSGSAPEAARSAPEDGAAQRGLTRRVPMLSDSGLTLCMGLLAACPLVCRNVWVRVQGCCWFADYSHIPAHEMLAYACIAAMASLLSVLCSTWHEHRSPFNSERTVVAVPWSCAGCPPRTTPVICAARQRPSRPKSGLPGRLTRQQQPAAQQGRMQRCSQCCNSLRAADTVRTGPLQRRRACAELPLVRSSLLCSLLPCPVPVPLLLALLQHSCVCKEWFRMRA